MIRGRLVLWADSVFEGQVITSFLEAADFQVDNLAAPGYIPHEPTGYDVAVVVLDRWDSNLALVSREIRAFTGNPSLPVIAIATRYPDGEDFRRRILLRPVRLFELVHTIQEVIHSQTQYPATSYRTE